MKTSLPLAVLPPLTWWQLLPHAGFGALAGATLAVLGQGAQLLRDRYAATLPAMESAAINKRRVATAALEAADQAELLWVQVRADEQNRRDREAMARLQQQRAQLRAAEQQQQRQEQQQQQQQDQEGMEMRNLGASSSSTQTSPPEIVNGELK